MDLKKRVKNLNIEIQSHFYYEKKKSIRRKIIPGNSKSLWSAVKTSKDMGTGDIPRSMTVGGRMINEHDRSDSFANFFDEKIKLITTAVNIDPNVYNGTRKLVANDLMLL